MDQPVNNPTPERPFRTDDGTYVESERDCATYNYKLAMKAFRQFVIYSLYVQKDIMAVTDQDIQTTKVLWDTVMIKKFDFKKYLSQSSGVYPQPIIDDDLVIAQLTQENALLRLQIRKLEEAGQTSEIQHQMPTEQHVTKHFTLPPNTHWVHSDLDLLPGDKLSITARGEISLTQGRVLPMGLDDFYRKDPSPLHNHFSVIGKIGETFISQEEIFYIGMDYAGIVRKAGTLFIGLNNSNWVLTGTGAFEVEIKLIRTMR